MQTLQVRPRRAEQADRPQRATGGARAAAAENVGNILAMEHVNITVPDPALAAQFYVAGLGLTRDPYLMVGPENMWVNVGDQQFHLPTRAPQVVPGHIGLVVPDLQALQERLKAVQPKLAGTKFAWSAGPGSTAVTCPWGNQLRCYEPSPRFGDMAIGIPYVEFLVRPGAADGIARFYRQVMGAPARVVHSDGAAEARVSIGQAQWLTFKETTDNTRPYDGHHIAIYIARFSKPYHFFRRRGLLMQDIAMHQFRFKEIVHPRTGERLFELEHEVRSLHHPMYRRPLVNRDPGQTLRRYARGHDALEPATR